MSTKSQSGHWTYSLRHPWVRGGMLACVVTGVLAASALAGWLPARTRTLALEADLGKITQGFRDREQLVARTAVLAEARRGALVLEAKLKHAGTQAQLIEELARLARSNDVQIMSEAYEELRRGGEHAVLATDLVVRGQYASIRRFIGALAALPTWSEIESCLLERGREPQVVNGKLRIVTYRARSQANT